MTKRFFTPPPRATLGNTKATILVRVKEGYLLWMSIIVHIPKGARYTLGSRIENRLLDLLELTHLAYFTEKEKREEKVSECILTLDTVKFLISVAWEGKLISNTHYEAIGTKLEEVGRMLGGWRKSLENPAKKNRDV